MGMFKICPRCGKVKIPYQDMYCDSCNEEVEINRKNKYRRYKSNRSDFKEQGFYISKVWRKKRRDTIFYYNGLDIYQLIANNKIVYADMVHHIIELKDDWSLRLKANNLMPLSKDTHMYIHTLYDKDKAGTQELLREIKNKFKTIYK